MNAHPSFDGQLCFSFLFSFLSLLFLTVFLASIHFSPSNFTHPIHPPIMKYTQLPLTLISMALLAKIDGVLKRKMEKGAVVKVVVTEFFFTMFERTF